jgi:hypothetical protein
MAGSCPLGFFIRELIEEPFATTSNKLFVDQSKEVIYPYSRRWPMLAKRTSKNQVTIPKEVIDHFKGIEYFQVSEQRGKIVLSPVTLQNTKDSLQEIRKKIKGFGISPKDIQEAIDWARKAAD